MLYLDSMSLSNLWKRNVGDGEIWENAANSGDEFFGYSFADRNLIPADLGLDDRVIGTLDHRCRLCNRMEYSY
jgi:hypothetical protein